MIELLLRLTALAGLNAAVFVARAPDADWVYKASALHACVSVLAFLLGRHGLRGKFVEGGLVLFDGLLVLLALCTVRQLPLFAWTVAIPAVLRNRARAFDGWQVGLLLAAAIIAAANLTSLSISYVLISQAAFILVISGLSTTSAEESQPQSGVSEFEEGVAEAPEAIPHQALVGGVVPLGMRLTDLQEAISKRSKNQIEKPTRERLLRRLLESDLRPEDFLAELHNTVTLRGIALFRLSADGTELFPVTHVGDVSYRTRNERIRLNPNSSDLRIKTTLISQLRDPEDSLPTSAMTLRSRNGLQGVLWFSADSTTLLEESTDFLEELATPLAQRLQEIKERTTLLQEVSRLNTVYGVVTSSEGATTANDLLSRLATDLFVETELESVQVLVMDGLGKRVLKSEGLDLNPLEVFQFQGQVGVAAWVRSGCKSVVVNDAHDHPEAVQSEAVRQRIGSFAIYPVRVQERSIGALCVASHRKGAVQAWAKSLQLTAEEAARSIARLQALPDRPTGILSSHEIGAVIARGISAVVSFELLDREELAPKFSEVEMTKSFLRSAKRLRSKLPADGSILVKPDSIIAILPSTSKENLRVWADDALEALNSAALRIGKGEKSRRFALICKVGDLREEMAGNDGENTGSEVIPA